MTGVKNQIRLWIFHVQIPRVMGWKKDGVVQAGRFAQHKEVVHTKVVTLEAKHGDLAG